MIIGIDGNEANVDKQVGVSVYTRSLLNYFQTVAGTTEWNGKKLKKPLEFRVYLRQKPNENMPKKSEYFSYVVVPGPFAWSQVFLPIYLALHRTIDVFFSPAHYAPRYCPVPLVVTIHDLSYFYYPEEFLKEDLYKLTKWTEYSIEKATSVIAVSKSTQHDIEKFYKVPLKKINVIYNGFEKSTHEANVQAMWRILADAYNLEQKKYILYVGTLQPRKNIPLLISAYRTFIEKNSDYKLVLTGKKGWLYDDIFHSVATTELAKNIIFTGYISDDEVAALYRNAFSFVMPSLYEGFGLPILEAMANGCPVISANTSSLPEIGGDACLYFNPNDEDNLTEKMQEFIQNPDKRSDYIQRGYERIKEFSWKTSAIKTLDTLIAATT